MKLGLGMWNFGEGDKESGFTSTATTGLNANYLGITSVFKL